MGFKSLSTSLAVAAGATVAAIIAASTAVIFTSVGGTIEDQSEQIQRETAASVKLAVSGRLEQASIVAESIRNGLGTLKKSGIVDRAVYDAFLKETLDKHTTVLGTWMGWEPDALDGKDKSFANTTGYDATGRFVPYWNRGSGSIVREVLTDYDKVGPGDYYLKPKNLRRAVAIEPYVYKVAGRDTLMTSFGLPVSVDGRFVGTAGVDIDLSAINAEFKTIKPFGDGYVAVVSTGGTIVSHPDNAAIGKPLAAVDAGLGETVAEAIKSGSQDLLTADAADGRPWRYLAVPFAAGGTSDRWAVVIAVPEDTIVAARRRPATRC